MSGGNTEPYDRPDLVPGERDFTIAINGSLTSGEPAFAKLQTDDRVLARITDGIYRQPSSALRELISNAYDADATEVVIETDAPRFREIRVRDNGRGMDGAALSRLVHHIGGSSKRTVIGATIGTTGDEDPNKSESGRKLIGKIGIGLFSVNQLTSHFQIITKIIGSRHRLVADVVLKAYSEEELPVDGKFDSGSVKVFAVPAEDAESHGTEIILKEIRPRAKNILRSAEFWQRYFEERESLDQEGYDIAPPPPWHCGYIDGKAPDEGAFFKEAPRLPWNFDDAPLARFKALFKAIADQTDVTERPELRKTLDTYLATLWALSLSAPVPYLESHPFDLEASDRLKVFRLSNTGRGRAEPMELAPGQTVRQKLGLKADADDPVGGFKVVVDQVELRRPVSFNFWKGRTDSFQHAMLFVGSYRPNLEKVHPDLRGGDLAFESYLFWNNRIIPKENNGILIRINGASNAVFDEHFMRYQVSEQTRLRQITSEVFISEGLDAALNIDRESFNFAHAHYQIVSNWLHRALRQFANTHKGLGDEIRESRRKAQSAESAVKRLQFAASTWEKARRTPDESPPVVSLLTKPLEIMSARREGVIALDRNQLRLVPSHNSKTKREDTEQREQIAKAIATVLDGFGLLSDMPYERQHELIAALIAVFFEDAQDA